MANNPYVNKVDLADGTTLMDLTGDTVTAGDMLTGTTAHDAAGRSITGTLSPVVKNDSDQWINGAESATKLGIACSTQYNDAFIQANADGGNVQVRKGNGNLAEFDSASMASNGTGYARIFTQYGGSNTKEFKFKQDGDFVNGNGVSMDTLDSCVGKIKRAARGGTNTTTGIFTFTMENSTSAFIMINANLICAYVTSGGTLYNSSLPTNYTMSRSGTTVTITKTASASAAATIAYIVISA